MEQKELWPGAGLWLDVPNITADDFAKVERCLKEIGDTLAQISFLKKLEIEFRDLEERHRASLRRAENVKEEAEEIKNPVIMDFMRRSIGFRTHVFVKLEKLIAIRKIEREEERERCEMPALAPADTGLPDNRNKSETQPSSEPAEEKPEMIEAKERPRIRPEFSAAQCCLAIHYLLHAAGHSQRDDAVKRFIVALTGWTEDSIRKRLVDMFTRDKQTPKDLKVLKQHFEMLGLVAIVDLIENELSDRKNDDQEDF